MSVNKDAVIIRLDERNRTFRQLHEAYGRMDILITALYQPALYTVREFEEIASEYRVLKMKADRLEAYMREIFPAKDLDEVMKRVKGGV